MQRAIVLGSPDGILIEPFFRPEQFFYRIIKCVDSACQRGIAGEFSERVVVQKWRRAPDADQRRNSIITRRDILLFWLELDRMRLVKRVEKFELVYRREFFVGERGKIVPDVTRFGIGCERASR